MAGIFFLDLIVLVGFLYNLFHRQAGSGSYAVSYMILVCFILVFSSLVLFVQNDKHSPSNVTTFIFSALGIISVIGTLLFIF